MMLPGFGLRLIEFLLKLVQLRGHGFLMQLLLVELIIHGRGGGLDRGFVALVRLLLLLFGLFGQLLHSFRGFITLVLNLHKLLLSRGRMLGCRRV